MSDEDLVIRGEVKAFRRSFVYYDDYYPDGDLVSGVTIEDIDCVPAAPHEMTAKELLYAERRMYNEDSDVYWKYSELVIAEEFDVALRYIEKWAREHPEEDD